MTYLDLLHVHVACVVITGAGFVARGLLMLRDSPLLARRWVRVLPHVVDTLLLSSALGLAVWSHRYPLVDAWLTAKLDGCNPIWKLKMSRTGFAPLGCGKLFVAYEFTPLIATVSVVPSAETLRAA